eukprot:scaffold18209_cov33-Tisochrysis_lutea.AAC.3
MTMTCGRKYREQGATGRPGGTAACPCSVARSACERGHAHLRVRHLGAEAVRLGHIDLVRARLYCNEGE